MAKRPQIKYCGNHSLEDIRSAASSHADYIGIVFAHQSKRHVDAEQVAEWLQREPVNDHQKLVGLFVNSSVEEIQSVLQDVPLDLIQCHGTESPEWVKEIREGTGLPIWKAIHHDEHALQLMRTYEGTVSGFVIDCKVKGQWGGTGKSFDWSAVPEYTEEARRQGVPCFIAGGIQADNVADLLRYGPEGIDISSGIEKNGQKDETEIRRLEERMNFDDTKCT